MLEDDSDHSPAPGDAPAADSPVTARDAAGRIALEAFPEQPVSLVDVNGEWQGPRHASARPDIDEDTLIALYRKLVAARMLDERLGVLQRSGRISFVAPGAGHEGAQIGIAHAMRPGHDWLFPYYRDSNLALAYGVPASEMFGQHMGSRADPAKGRQMPCHPSSKDLHIFTAISSIATHVPPAVGMALASKLKGSDEVSVATFGDGATSEGDWYAALNLAGARKVPMIFACENNRYAISVDFETQTASQSICDKARACGLPGYRVDGMDVVSAYCVMREVLRRVRAGDGPALVEFDVCRYGPHSSADDDSVYRSRAEVDAWKERDPITRMRRFLAHRDLWDDDREQALKAEVTADFDAAIDAARAAGKPDAEAMFDDVHAQRPWHLSEQAARLAAEL